VRISPGLAIARIAPPRRMGRFRGARAQSQGFCVDRVVSFVKLLRQLFRHIFGYFFYFGIIQIINVEMCRYQFWNVFSFITYYVAGFHTSKRVLFVVIKIVFAHGLHNICGGCIVFSPLTYEMRYYNFWYFDLSMSRPSTIIKEFFVMFSRHRHSTTCHKTGSFMLLRHATPKSGAPAGVPVMFPTSIQILFYVSDYEKIRMRSKILPLLS